MNHDYTHCLAYSPKCPKGCFRGELVRDLRNNPMMAGIPVSWADLSDTEECRRAGTAKNWIDIFNRHPEMTNADVIRNMTDDELAVWMASAPKLYISSEDGWREWLRVSGGAE